MPGPTTRQNCLVASGGVNWASASLTQRTEPKKGEKVTGEKTKTDMLGRSGRSVAAAPVEYFLDSRLTERLVDRLIHSINVKKRRFFTFFDVFLFSKRFFIFKNVGKVQSGKQINKKHFQNNSNETDL